MKHPLILHIETATDICSVALSKGDHELALIESGQSRSHASLLNTFIRQSLEKAGLTFKDLNAVAISKGPGSYTGLRIGVSTAKGLAYALRIPLLASGTLENMASASLSHSSIQELLNEHGSQLLLCPMLDARRMEVYSAFYTSERKQYREVRADIINEESYRDILENHHVCFFGNGSDKCQEVLKHSRAHFISDVNPSAAHMCEPVWNLFQEGKKEDDSRPFHPVEFSQAKNHHFVPLGYHLIARCDKETYRQEHQDNSKINIEYNRRHRPDRSQDGQDGRPVGNNEEQYCCSQRTGGQRSDGFGVRYRCE